MSSKNLSDVGGSLPGDKELIQNNGIDKLKSIVHPCLVFSQYQYLFSNLSPSSLHLA
jgi:hypothetical protein